MPSIEELSSLLERVKAATGVDLNLERDIAAAFYGYREGKMYHAHHLRMHEYTASLDAITALIERQLPGWRYDFHSPRASIAWEGRSDGAQGKP